MLLRKTLLSACLVLVVGLASSVYAQGTPTGVKSGFFLGAFFAHATVGGDFDDSIYYESDTALYNVPDVESGGGFGFSMGGRFQGGVFELLYQRTTHDTHTLFTDIGDQKAYYNTVDFNFKFDVFAQHMLRPYILVGFGFPWITIQNNKYDGSSFSDETFNGIAGNLGTGLAYYFTPRWCLNGGLVYRWASFSTLEGEQLDESLSSSGPGFTLGMAYTF